MNKVVALKEIRLQPEEGAPFTAIREGIILSVEQIILTYCLILFFFFAVLYLYFLYLMRRNFCFNYCFFLINFYSKHLFFEA